LKDQKEVFAAWVNGETMQWEMSDGVWLECRAFSAGGVIDLDCAYKYRIKPKEIREDVYIWRSTSGHRGITSNSHCVMGRADIQLTWSEDGMKLLKCEIMKSREEL